jgi:hypothetical protein
MAGSRWQLSSPTVTATLGAATVSAQFIAGKAARDALYLAHLDVTSLPAILVASSAVSLVLVILSSKALSRIAPGTFVPLLFVLNALLLAVEWRMSYSMPALTARIVYLQISGLGPVLGSGFWLIATDRFDPHTAKQRFGQLAGASALAGLAAALVTERDAALYGIEATLPLLAVLSLACGYFSRRLAAPEQDHPHPLRIDLEQAPELAAVSPQSGLRVLGRTSYLRNLAALVVLGTIAAALVDYVFKVQVVNAFGRGDTLLRFFAIYYAAISLLSFVVQAGAGTAALQRLGLAFTTTTPSLALFAGGIGALIAPGLQGTLVARGAESVFRGSLFKTGYEIFYTPVPSAEKRVAKPVIDVGFDRLGDAIGGGLVRLLLMLPIAMQYNAILLSAIVCSAIAIVVARQLTKGYIDTLERNLLNRAVELDLSDVQDEATRTIILNTLPLHSRAMTMAATQSEMLNATTRMPAPAVRAATDPELEKIAALRSRNRDRVLSVLRQDEELPASLIPHVISLLAWDPVATEAGRALRKIVEDHVGELIDALINPNQPFAVRRRLARVFSTCVSQRAADGLMLGLEDLRFEVRYQCGRSLAAILEKNARIRIDKERVFDAVRREMAVGRPVWESQRLLDEIDLEEQAPFVDEFLKDRAGQSLAHVFTLLSLVLPTQPLQIAYRGLHTNDPGLRGTALEYLDGVLPADIRTKLWPYVGGEPGGPRNPKSREAVLDDLLRSHDSIQMNLEELRRRARSSRPDAAAGA